MIYVFLVAGYNHLEVVELLLEQGADVNAKDKGGLIPLHNASSFGVSHCQSVSHPWQEFTCCFVIVVVLVVVVIVVVAAV